MKAYTCCIFILLLYSCTPFKIFLTGYKENISTNDKKIKAKFENKNGINCNFYEGSSPKALIQLLASFSSGNSNSSNFNLPLPVVLDNQDKKIMNPNPNQEACFGGFEEKIKSIEHLDYFEPDSIRYVLFLNNVLGVDALANTERYNLFIFWTQKTYRANNTQMRKWIELAKQNPDLKIWAINVDMCLFATEDLAGSEL